VRRRARAPPGPATAGLTALTVISGSGGGPAQHVPTDGCLSLLRPGSGGCSAWATACSSSPATWLVGGARRSLCVPPSRLGRRPKISEYAQFVGIPPVCSMSVSARQLLDRSWTLGRVDTEAGSCLPRARPSIASAMNCAVSASMGRQIDVVPCGDRTIIAKESMRHVACFGIVNPQAKKRAPGWGARERTNSYQQCKTNPEVRASPSSLALTS